MQWARDTASPCEQGPDLKEGRGTVTSGTRLHGRHLCLSGVPHYHQRSVHTLELGATCQARQIEVILRLARVLESAKGQALQPAARASGLHLALHALIDAWD